MTTLSNLKWENILVPFKPVSLWVDTGLYLEYEHAMISHAPDNVEVRLLLEKRLGDFISTANLVAGHNIGPHSGRGTDTGLGWRTKYHVSDQFEPGFEYYSDFGTDIELQNFNRQEHALGPVVQGKFGDLTYDTGVLFGLSGASHDVTVKLNLEYEF